MNSLSRRATALVCGAALMPVAAFADAAQEKALASGGAWHYRSFRCVDTKVAAVGSRLQGEPQSGSVVRFATSLGFEGVTGSGAAPRAGVTSYDRVPAIARERPGDAVQVCLLSIALPVDGCDPDTDPRGRTYRVYDYGRHVAYVGSNAEHDCGGA